MDAKLDKIFETLTNLLPVFDKIQTKLEELDQRLGDLEIKIDGYSDDDDYTEDGDREDGDDVHSE